MLVRLLQSRKALSPMLVTVLQSVMDSSAFPGLEYERPEKTKTGMLKMGFMRGRHDLKDFTDLGKVKVIASESGDKAPKAVSTAFARSALELLPTTTQSLNELYGRLLAGGGGLGKSALFLKLLALGVNDFEETHEAGLVAEFHETGGFPGRFGRLALGGEGKVEIFDA